MQVVHILAGSLVQVHVEGWSQPAGDVVVDTIVANICSKLHCTHCVVLPPCGKSAICAQCRLEEKESQVLGADAAGRCCLDPALCISWSKLTVVGCAILCSLAQSL